MPKEKGEGTGPRVTPCQSLRSGAMLAGMKFALFLLAPFAALAVELPPPAGRAVDFSKDIQPLLEVACIKCHAKGKAKGGFSLETRALFMKGGDTSAAAVIGKSAESLIVKLVASDDPDERMPKKGDRKSVV